MLQQVLQVVLLIVGMTEDSADLRQQLQKFVISHHRFFALSVVHSADAFPLRTIFEKSPPS